MCSQTSGICGSSAGEKNSERPDRSVVVMADIAASVLSKLKNKAKSSGISYQQCLQLFFQEEFLRRVDVDFLLRGLNNDPAKMDERFL